MLVLKRESISFISYLNFECVGLVNHKKFKEVLANLHFEPPPCSDTVYVRSGFTKYFPSYSLTFLASIKVSFTIKSSVLVWTATLIAQFRNLAVILSALILKLFKSSCKGCKRIPR